MSKCEDCYYEFPLAHKDCGGLIHVHYLDEDYDNIILTCYCERCGKILTLEDAREEGLELIEMNEIKVLKHSNDGKMLEIEAITPFSPFDLQLEPGEYEIQVPEEHEENGKKYVFDHWDDGVKENTRTIKYPKEGIPLKIVYREKKESSV